MPNNSSNDESSGNRPGELISNSDKSTKSDDKSSNITQTSKSGTNASTLKSIDANVKAILNAVSGMSQSAARQHLSGSKSSDDKWQPFRSANKSKSKGNKQSKAMGSLYDQFIDGLSDELLDSLGASDLKKSLQGSINELAKGMGVEVSDIPSTLGKQLGKQLANSQMGKAISEKVKTLSSNALDSATNLFKDGMSSSGLGEAMSKGLKKGLSFFKGAGGAEGAASAAAQATNIASGVAGTSEAATTIAGVSGLAEGAAGAGEALMGLTATAGSAIATGGLVIAGMLVLDKVIENVTPALEGMKEVAEASKASANRSSDERKKFTELQKERIKADINTLVTEPFELLKKAATSLYDVWDNQLRTISATQGYNKSDVQDLMSSYAQRLRDEGLTSVVSGSDIMNNLSNVLNSGLSGKVAEEFAYLATKLNAAVPTQDFFSYADTYASLAAQAIQQGKSQEEAISYANKELESFASNVLYASRQLSGGFSSGLKNAQTLFQQSAQIAAASKTGDPAQISGVLTSISAIAGAVAPDLASGIVDAVVKAATGGNSSDIVALRSLAGINASNTEFLQALAKDPKAVFTELFTNLGKMQNMSNDNFMEVAEGLSSVFGISMDAFSRVDFNYLAKSISEMNVNNASLDENIKLLASGETTTTTEQLKMQQINKYMLDEGLSYVLDNEASRAIQEHMWDEQMKRDLQETEYAVNLQGAALDALTGIKQTVENIRSFLNPFALVKKVANLIGTASESAALKADTVQVLEKGKVGKGDASSLYNLTTSNKDLHLTQQLVDLMGGTSAYGKASSIRKFNTALLDTQTGSPSFGISALLGAGAKASAVGKSLLNSLITKSGPTSKYQWSGVGKSIAKSLATTQMNTTGVRNNTTNYSNTSTSASNAIKNKSKANLQKFIDSMKSAAEAKMSFDEWKSTASKYGINDLSAMLEDYGVTENDLEGEYGSQQASVANEYKHNREVQEDEFWKQATSYALNTQPAWLAYQQTITTNQQSLITLVTATNTQLSEIWKRNDTFFTTYLNEWRNYFVKHTAYSAATLNSYKAADIIKSEKKSNGDAVLALAQALTQNTIGIKEGFQDPVVQTNVLLAKILLVVETLMQQNNTTGQLSLPDALAALSTGMVTKTK